MVCEHLAALEKELLAAGIAVTFRGPAWGTGTREWVYFDCCLDRAAIRARMAFAECVEEHEHYGTQDGQEAGFVCTACHDAVMGVHPKSPGHRRLFQ